MWYAINCQSHPDTGALRSTARAEHTKRVQQLKDLGQLLVAGPYPAIDNSEPGDAGFTGSLIIADFTSLDEARAWAEADPYRTAGVYSTMEIKPFKNVLP